MKKPQPLSTVKPKTNYSLLQFNGFHLKKKKKWYFPKFTLYLISCSLKPFQARPFLSKKKKQKMWLRWQTTTNTTVIHEWLWSVLLAFIANVLFSYHTRCWRSRTTWRLLDRSGAPPVSLTLAWLPLRSCMWPWAFLDTLSTARTPRVVSRSTCQNETRE